MVVKEFELVAMVAAAGVSWSCWSRRGADRARRRCRHDRRSGRARHVDAVAALTCDCDQLLRA